MGDPIAATVRKETEILIGRLVMQNTSLTAQMNALTETAEGLKKELDADSARAWVVGS